MISPLVVALLILVFAILFFVTEWLRVDVVALMVVVALMLSGLLTPQEAFAGFSNSAVLTIAALFVIGGGVMQTGLANMIGERILMVAGVSPTRLTVVIMLTVALLSCFMSDTGTVAVLLPAIISLAWKAKVSPSKLLIPLSYGSLLGGVMTLIGTPPNIIVSDLLRENGFPAFRFFDYAPLGFCLLIAGVTFMALIGQRLLPDHHPEHELQTVETPQELAELYRLPDDMYRLRVRRLSPLCGKTLAEAQLRQNWGLTVLEIIRTPTSDVPARKKTSAILLTPSTEKIKPMPETVLQTDDILIVKANVDKSAPVDVGHVAAALNLGMQPAQADDERSLINQEAGLAEVLLPPRSSLIGKTLAESRFASLYRLTVLGIRRPGTDLPHSAVLKDIVLHFGDTLLVQGAWKDIIALRKQRRDFVVMGEPEEMLKLPAREKAPIALIVLLGMLFIMITNWLPLSTASMLAALVMILSGCLTIDDAYETIDWKSIVLIAGMLPMSTALEKVGLVDSVARGLSLTLGNFGPIWVLGGLFLMTSLFTQVLSNTATTVLIAPVALAAAHQLGVQPQAFLMAVAVAASMAMASPIASPVNTLVMGAGSYRFSDYIKVGVPLVLVMLAITIMVLPVFWHF